MDAGEGRVDSQIRKMQGNGLGKAAVVAGADTTARDGSERHKEPIS